ncbi:MAG: 6-phosphogluconolactonase [Rikenellaceae bacterium]|nr:6-phosphogluconolactonase [Rikenellaceae bacterium]
MNYNYPQARELTEILINAVRNKDGFFYLAVSGGNGASVLFKLWRDIYSALIPWEKIEIFWVDERCVPADHPESNYGNAKRELLDHVYVEESRIHRLIGENDNTMEASRYSKLVNELLPQYNFLPQFDMIILGIGEDGHTSSIFPGQDYLMNFPEPYAPSVNPYTGQKRVAMTASTILNASELVFYLYGESKKAIIEKIAVKPDNYSFPALFFLENRLNCRLFWDR